jgi:predicted acyltransferase
MKDASMRPVKMGQPISSTESLSGAMGRMGSVDAYRGFVMLLMMGEVLNLSAISRAKPDSGFWHLLAYHQTHVEWQGCSLHDLIQPGFSFLVGVALPFSLAKRRARGEPPGRMIAHAFGRALALILLGVFLRSVGSPETRWTFEDTLTQIGLGYGFLFLIGLLSRSSGPWIALVAILSGYWLAFSLFPLPGADFDYSAAGADPTAPFWMRGFAAHWNKNTNLAWAFDRWFLNLFPRSNPFAFNEGGYATLSFVPTLGTMLLGLVSGNKLRGDLSPGSKMRWLLIAGVISLLFGWTLDFLGICPSVKRIWTPAWTLFSGGWCLLFLGAFYWIMEIRKIRAWAFPFTVVGANSIAAYFMAHLFEGFVVSSLKTHFGKSAFRFAGEPYEPVVRGAATLLALWLLLYWMYRRRLFLRI